jgi:hypothetical protein
MSNLTREREELQRTLEVAGKALKHVSHYPTAADEIEQAKGSLPLHAEVDADTHAAILNAGSMLPADLQNGVQASEICHHISLGFTLYFYVGTLPDRSSSPGEEQRSVIAPLGVWHLKIVAKLTILSEF